MSFTVVLGLLLAVCCAVIALLGFLLKQRGAVGAPPVQWRHPVRSTVALFANRIWTIGIIVATLAWVFHVAALSLAPISLVQSVIAGGLVLLTPLADKLFGIRARRREWIGVGLAAAGLALLAATLEGGAEEAYSSYEAASLWGYAGVVTTLAVGLCFLVLDDGPRAGVVLGISGGLLWGASDVVIKALSGSLGDDGLLVLLTVEALFILVVSLVGLVVSARSLQLGPAVAVIALTSVAANVVTIASGPIIFGEPLPEGGGALTIRLLAFALVVVGAGLTPGPGAAEHPPVAPEPLRA